MGVCLFSPYLSRMQVFYFLRRIILSSVACVGVPYSSTLSHEGHDYLKK